MSVAVKTIIYLALVTAVYCDEYDVPVMLYYRRMVYLINFKIAAFMCRHTMTAYRSYVDEAEYVRG